PNPDQESTIVAMTSERSPARRVAKFRAETSTSRLLARSMAASTCGKWSPWGESASNSGYSDQCAAVETPVDSKTTGFVAGKTAVFKSHPAEPGHPRENRK